MYPDRLHAGQVLKTELLKILPQWEGPYQLLAVPRGGVVTAMPISEELGIPMEPLIVRKLRHPQHMEVAIGSVMPDGTSIVNEDILIEHNITRQYVEQEIEEQRREIQRRLLAYHTAQSAFHATDHTILVVDDGIATGYTLRAAVQWLKEQNPQAIILLVPVAPADVVAQFRKEVSHVVCPLLPDPFFAVGMYYQDFKDTSDEEVRNLLTASRCYRDIFATKLYK